MSLCTYIPPLLTPLAIIFGIMLTGALLLPSPLTLRAQRGAETSQFLAPEPRAGTLPSGCAGSLVLLRVHGALCRLPSGQAQGRAP